jgi:hypothetical protein
VIRYNTKEKSYLVVSNVDWVIFKHDLNET